jgi:hypothetical protein
VTARDYLLTLCREDGEPIASFSFREERLPSHSEIVERVSDFFLAHADLPRREDYRFYTLESEPSKPA